MNIQTVAENLRRTIAGKEHMLDSHKRYLRGQGITIAETMASETIVKFLEINIDELKRILKDVEQCVDHFEKLKKENSDMGWEINPDRMGQ
jgi:flagellar biosynthesis chaperone FliJ